MIIKNNLTYLNQELQYNKVLNGSIFGDPHNAKTILPLKD